MLSCVFIFIFLHFTHPFHLLLPLLSSVLCSHTHTHTKHLSVCTTHTQKHSPLTHSYRTCVRYWARENERGGREEMREGVVEHRDISQVWQWSRISFPGRPLWTLSRILSAPTAEPKDRLNLHTRKSHRSSPRTWSAAEPAWRPTSLLVQVQMPPEGLFRWNIYEGTSWNWKTHSQTELVSVCPPP